MRGILTALALSLVAATPGWRAAQPGSLLKLEREEEVMGSSFSMVLYGREQASLESAATAAFQEVDRLDQLLSNYKPASEWSLVNREAGRRAVRVSDELFALLSSCIDYSRRSDGAFDITVGPLMKTWGFYMGEGNRPRPAEVSATLDRVGYRFVRLDRAARTVRFTRPDVELDPGGIGKGYAVDRVVEVLKGRGVDAALVSAAGSSIYGMGAPPDDPRGWPITIRTPRRPDETAAQVVLKNRSLSTSGSYEKFFWAEGRTYAHIMDPRTGYPASGVASVSVLASRTIDSEAWTKPFFINGRAWTTAHKPKDLRVFFCETGTPGVCVWLP
jgi:FAD:protein FMN transferase